MPTKRGIFSSGKISDSHTTIVETAEPMLESAVAMAAVTKVVVSIIHAGLGGGSRRLRFKPIPAGLKMSIRGAGCLQEFYIYTKSPAQVEKGLREHWTRMYG